MPLPLFNLRIHIKNYNVQAKRKEDKHLPSTYSEDETFDYYPFAVLLSSQSLIQAINEAYDLFIHPKKRAIIVIAFFLL